MKTLCIIGIMGIFLLFFFCYVNPRVVMTMHAARASQMKPPVEPESLIDLIKKMPVETHEDRALKMLAADVAIGFGDFKESDITIGPTVGATCVICGKIADYRCLLCGEYFCSDNEFICLITHELHKKEGFLPGLREEE